MEILVLMKQTFDTEEKIVIRDGRVSDANVEFIINPYDEYAVEEAIKLKEEHGGEVTVLTVGPERTENALRTALAMGADKAVRIELGGLKTDAYVLANIIAAAVRSNPYELILGGYMAVDSGAGQVAVRVAEKLGIPHVSAITKLTLDGGKAVVERDAEGDTEIIEIRTPFLATAQQGLNEPRYPSLPGIMKAKKKPMDIVTVDQLALEPDEIQAKTRVIEDFAPPKKQAGRRLEGDPGEQVRELVRLLQTEAKIIS